jgi:hypothetical protein
MNKTINLDYINDRSQVLAEINNLKWIKSSYGKRLTRTMKPKQELIDKYKLEYNPGSKLYY